MRLRLGRRSAFFLVLAALCAGAGPARGGSADSTTVAAVADATASAAAPRAHLGAARSLQVATRPQARAYLRFRVPAGTVTKAQVRLTATSGSGRVSVRATSGRWAERGLTRVNAPAPTGRAVVAAIRKGAVTIDVTGLVRARDVNLVVSALRGRATFASRETGARGPRLTVESRTEPADPTLLAAGDIAGCDSSGDEATAALLGTLPGTIAALGDLAYESGTAAEFASCYDPTWGRFKDRTKPAPGNHEYESPGAAPYYAYFGAAAGNPAEGYYSYDVGSWHIVALNSNCSFVSCTAGSTQERWLRADLAAHPAACTLAYWHHPRFSSGQVPSDSTFTAFWQALYDAGADVVLNGHAHNYQRYAPQTPAGAADPQRGIREFVVGTGGKSHHPVTPAIANEEVVNADSFGVLRLTLHANGYDWRFLPVAGASFTDSGSGICH